jgi:SpoVK/Ycf46/Vps4 family AAA+-type ATPase
MSCQDSSSLPTAKVKQVISPLHKHLCELAELLESCQPNYVEPHGLMMPVLREARLTNRPLRHQTSEISGSTVNLPNREKHQVPSRDDYNKQSTRLLRNLRRALRKAGLVAIADLKADWLRVLAVLFNDFLIGLPGRSASRLSRMLVKSPSEVPSALELLHAMHQDGLVITNELKYSRWKGRKKQELRSGVSELAESKLGLADRVKFDLLSKGRCMLNGRLRAKTRKESAKKAEQKAELMPTFEPGMSISWTWPECYEMKIEDRQFHTELLDLGLTLFANAEKNVRDLPSDPYSSACGERRRLLHKVYERYEELEAGPLEEAGQEVVDRIEREWLDGNEICILLCLFYAEVNEESPTPDNLATVVAIDQLDRFRVAKYLRPEARLRKSGLIRAEVASSPFGSSEELSIDPHFFQLMIGQEIEVSTKHSLDFVKKVLNSQEEDILQLAPVMPWSKLVLDASTKEQLVSSLLGSDDLVLKRLQEWGVSTVSCGDSVSTGSLGAGSANAKQGTCILLSGPSGTGKTFAAGALADRLGKAVVTTDISRIESKWAGGSQKHVRQLFESYHQLVDGMDNPPVLLLNECDQFLSQRGDMDSDVGVMRHQMQNLFLEYLENPKGVVVATTNLVDCLDEAYSRRFHHKIVIGRPKPAEREALWKVHLPSGVPCDGSVDLKRMARAYPFSGGQIAVAMRNALNQAAHQGVLTQTLLHDASLAEIRGGFAKREERVDVSIGFSVGE